MTHHSWFVVILVGHLISLITIPFILMSQKRPAGILAWLWAVILFPYLAPLFYLLFGSEQIYRRRLLRRHLYQLSKAKSASARSNRPVDPETNEISRHLSSLNLYRATVYDEATLLLDAQQYYPALVKAIEGARESILFETFIWRNDAYGLRFLDGMTAAVKRGVQVRLILDEMGSYAMFRSHFRQLIDAGGKFSWFNALNPWHNRWAFSLRNHRKLQLIDSEIAFVGGMNIGREYMGESSEYGSWRDIQVRLTGPVVQTLTRTFEEDWFFATGETLSLEKEVSPSLNDPTKIAHVIESGPDSNKFPLLLTILMMLNLAKSRLWITAGYFFPQEPLLSGLKLAAARGVDVRILVGTHHEHPYIVQGARFYYEELLRAGVKIFEYNSGMHHAKVTIMDHSWVSIGSANLDVRSMRLNFELNVVMHSEELASILQLYLEKDFGVSELITLEKVQAASPWTRTVHNLCRLVGPIV